MDQPIGPTGVRDLLFHLDREAGVTLQVQLRRRVVSAILGGQLPPGEALPSCRQLADRLGVARNTVMLAYQHLVDEGYLESRERSGYYVCEDVLRGRTPAAHPPGTAGDDPANTPPPGTAGAAGGRPAPGLRGQDAGSGPIGPVTWVHRFKMLPTNQSNINKPRDWARYRYPFVTGQPDPSIFPLAAWRDCSRQALSLTDVRDWTADRVGNDDPMLVERLVTHVLPRRGVLAEPDQVLITVGAQQALFLIASLLVGPGTTVGVEDPGYADARNIFAIHTPRVRPLPVDAAGLVVDGAGDRTGNGNGEGTGGGPVAGCDYVYVTPSHQHPTTVTLPLVRRRTLLAAARADDFVLIEDDYESESNYAGPPTPALKALDRDGRVIYIGSLSKTVAPGLRLGYLVAPAPLVAELRALRRLMMRHPPGNNQRMIALFIANGHYDALVRRLHHIYRGRWEAMRRALERHLPGTAVAPAYGGTSFWVRGPTGLDSMALAEAALAEDVVIEPGTVCFANGGPHPFFRLGFSSIPAERIEGGVQRLAQTLVGLS